MFAGHVGAAMALSRVERRLNLGVLVFSALLLDVVLWVLVLLRREAVLVPADYATRHQLQFVFPYSHGMLAGFAWSVAAALFATLVLKRSGRDCVLVAWVVAAAVVSHWLLDAMVHTPEIPLLGEASAKVGLSLWDHLPIALVVESLLALGGLWLYLGGVVMATWRKATIAVLAVLILVMTVAGMTVAPAPPGAVQIATSSLFSIAVLVALLAWLDRGRRKT